MSSSSTPAPESEHPRVVVTAEEALSVPASALQPEKQQRLGSANEPAISIRAMVSMALGILGAPVVGILVGPIAIGLGLLALRQIDGPEKLRGRGLALSGIALGTIDTVLWVFLIIFYGNHLV